MPAVFFFKPPYSWEKLVTKNKSENRWLEGNFHGILCRSGSILYVDVGRALNYRSSRSNLRQGLEKAKWLRKLLADKAVYNIEDLAWPVLKKIPIDYISCTNHQAVCPYPVCAYRNAIAMKIWMIERQKCFDTVYSMYN